MKKMIITLALMVSVTFGMRTVTESHMTIEQKSSAQLAEELQEMIDSIQKAKEQEALEKKWRMLEKVLGEIVDEMDTEN